MSDETLRGFQRRLEKMAAELALATGESKAILFKDFALSYLIEKQNKPSLRDSTKNSFRHQTMKHLIPNFGHLPLHGTNWAAEFDSWVTQTRKENENNKDPHITRFFNPKKDLNEILLAAFVAGHIDKKVKLDNPDAKRETGRWVTDAEIIRLLWRAKRPFRVIFYVFWKMGCRPREILKWRWDMFKWGGRDDTWINVPESITKTVRARTIPLNPDVCRLLIRRHARGNGSPFVFPNRADPKRPQLTYHSAWSLARMKAGVPKCVPYDMRRSIISRWAKEGKPITYAAKLLDSSPELLQSIYTKFDPNVMRDLIK